MRQASRPGSTAAARRGRLDASLRNAATRLARAFPHTADVVDALGPDGHANLTFAAVPQRHFSKLNLSLTNAVDVIAEVTDLVKRMNDNVVKKRPGKS
jgi:hypothetical protein